MKRLCCAMAAVALLGTALAVATTAVHEGAAAETGVKVGDVCRISEDQPRINILLLLDASGSLRENDPSNARRDGLEAAVENLASLAQGNPKVEISIAVDTFATRYIRQYDWNAASGAGQDLSALYGRITALSGQSTFTDYRQAMQGAAGRFQEAPEGGCNLLLWFTDGEHATPGDEEHQEILDLCESDALQSMDNKVWTLAVLLSSPASPPDREPLEQVFGERAPCRYDLDGDISADVGAEELSRALSELIAEAVYEVEIDEPLEYEECSDGIGTVDDPCEYTFSLSADEESFRLFVDMTWFGRGIENPADIKMRLQSPSGEPSELIVPIDLASGESSSRYLPVLPFWFLARRPYESRWELIGHQAAEQLTEADDWEWEGDWKLLFWGDTPEEAEDASKVAAAFRAVTEGIPSTDLSLSDEESLIGYIENYPKLFEASPQEEGSVELRLMLLDSAAEPLYPTRGPVSCRADSSEGANPVADICDPVAVRENDRKFEVERLFDQLLWWDSEEAGGDEMQLAEAVEQRSPMQVVAVLDQEFLYGGPDGYGPDGERGKPLSWRRNIGTLELPNLEEVLEGRDRWNALVDWVEDGAVNPLPYDVTLQDPPYDLKGDRVDFVLRVRPGYLDGVVALTDLRARDEGRTLPEPAFEQGWSCEVAGTRWHQGPEWHECPLPIEVDLGLSEDANAVVDIDFAITASEDIEARLRDEVRVPLGEKWDDLWDRIRAAAVDQTESVESEVFSVDVKTSSEKRNEFLLALLLLAVLALLLRAFAAWRLRPWSPLNTPDYLVLPLSGGTGTPGSETDGDRCMDLARRAPSATIAGVRLSSLWRTLLLGGPPRIGAISPNGICVGPRGSIATRRGQRIGVIGQSLRQGWVAEDSRVGRRLIVWDLPEDEGEQAIRIAEIRSIAEERLRQAQAQASDGPSGGTPDVPDQEPPSTDSGNGNPFDNWLASAAANDDSLMPGESDPFSSGGQLKDPFES